MTRTVLAPSELTVSVLVAWNCPLPPFLITETEGKKPPVTFPVPFLDMYQMLGGKL